MAAMRLYPGCICIALSKTSARCDQIVPTVRHTTTHSDTPTHRAVCQVCVKLWHILSVSVCYVVTSDTYNVARVCQYSTTLCTLCYCPLRPNNCLDLNITPTSCMTPADRRIGSWGYRGYNPLSDVTRYSIELEIQISYLASRPYISYLLSILCR